VTDAVMYVADSYKTQSQAGRPLAWRQLARGIVPLSLTGSGPALAGGCPSPPPLAKRHLRVSRKGMSPHCVSPLLSCAPCPLTVATRRFLLRSSPYLSQKPQEADGTRYTPYPVGV
jgi:hypothetical protein